MSRAGRDPASFVPLKPRVLEMLLVLLDEPQHGYAIKEELARRTGGKIDPGPGTLYRTLHRLLADGLVAETDRRPEPEQDDERRRYYRITALGRQVTALEARRLAGLVEIARAGGLLS